jgi:hypothetical protein
MPVIDLKKRLKTREGLIVTRLLASDIASDFPVVACVRTAPGREEVWSYTKDGEYTAPGRSHSRDLLEMDDDEGTKP